MANQKITQLTAATTLADNDQDAVVQNYATTPVTRRRPFSLLKSTLKTYFDTLYVSLTGYATLPLSTLDGLTLSNNGTDANNDIDIATGKGVDSGGTENMVLASALTKRLDAAWSVGTNQGGLDTGTKAVSTWYHLWLIKRVDTGVVDVLFSTSATAPTMPTNYTKKRRIGAVRTDGSGNLLAFLQYADEFCWLSPPALDVNATITTTRGNHTLTSIPSGVVVKVMMNLLSIHATQTPAIYISNPNLTDLAPSFTATPLGQNRAGATAIPGYIEQYSDASAQISSRSENTSTTLRVAVLGWHDPRGKR